MTIESIEASVREVIAKCDRDIAALMELRDAQQRILEQYQSTAGVTAAKPGGSTSGRSASNQQATQTPAGAASAGISTSASAGDPAISMTSQGSGQEAGQTQTVGRKKPGPRKGSKRAQPAAENVAPAPRKHRQAKSAGAAKAARKPRAASTRPAAKSRSRGGDTPAPASGNAKHEAATPNGTGAHESQPHLDTGAGKSTASATSRSQPTGQGVWESLLGARGKSAAELARAAARTMDPKPDRQQIDTMAQQASEALEKLVAAGAAKAHGEGGARVFMRA